VEDILFRETVEKMETCERQDGSVPMVTSASLDRLGYYMAFILSTP